MASLGGWDETRTMIPTSRKIGDSVLKCAVRAGRPFRIKVRTAMIWELPTLKLQRCQEASIEKDLYSIVQQFDCRVDSREL